MKSQFLKSLTYLFSALACGLTVQNAHALSCGDSIAGDVVLTENMHCVSGSTALEVVNSSITIDLNGFTLSGLGGLSGVNIDDYDNITVKNGSIKGFWAGVSSSRSDKLNVTNVTFYEVGVGVVINAGNNASITDNDFIKTSSPAVSIRVSDSMYTANENVISNNEFYRAYTGISICGDQADKNIISDNLIWKSTDRGIQLNRSNRNQIYRNQIIETPDGSALRLNNSSYNTITDNSIVKGGYSAVTVLGGAGSGCLELAKERSVKNRFIENQITDFNYAFVLGLGVGSPYNVEGNGILNNAINDNTVGIHFRSDTYNNYAKGNDFTNTVTPISDAGVNNQY